jgi:hypothetical protein
MPPTPRFMPPVPDAARLDDGPDAAPATDCGVIETIATNIL